MNKYIVNLTEAENTHCKASLFLFPYAGGGTAVFKEWVNYFSDINLFCILYPGRENRFSEKALEDIDLLANDIFNEMENTIDFSKPYFLFGHSMGTKVVYEVALRIQKSGYRSPTGVIISAGRAPCFMEPNPIHHLDNEGFIEGIKRFSGTPKEIIENENLMRLFLPMLRADFIIDEKYCREDNEKLSSDMLSLMGDNDVEMTVDELLKWKDFTENNFFYKMIEGGHMFINTNKEDVIKNVSEFIGHYI